MKLPIKVALSSFFSLWFVVGNAICLQEISLEEKVGQLFVVSFKGAECNNDVVTLVEKIGVGGVIYYTWANDLSSAKQIFTLSSDLQKRAKIPLLILTDQEGGIVSRLQGEEFTLFPGNKALAMTGDPLFARESSRIIGKELKSVGINGNLAPVVDVNSNPKNPIIGIRSFGEEVDTVIDFAEAALDGYQKAEVISCIKHFPGHGDVEVDSHTALPILMKSKEELNKIELAPFAALAKKADMVMTAHLMVPSIDPKRCATTSKPILDILRKEIGFQGVIITDSLTMEGVLCNSGSLEQAAVDALNAGCDILLFGGKKLIGNVDQEITIEEITRVYQRIIDAVRNGEISPQRLDEAVERILTLKNKYPLQSLSYVREKPSPELAYKIASLALEVSEKNAIIDSSHIAIIAPSLTKASLENLTSKLEPKQVTTLFFTGLAPTVEEQKKAYEITKGADHILFFSYNAWKNKSQEELLRVIASLGKPMTQVILRDSLDESLIGSYSTVIKTFGPTKPSLEAVCDKIVQLTKRESVE